MTRPHEPLDTHTLRTLVAVLTERNLTRVAARLNQTQPAVSAVLRKLRLTFGDELLIRSGNAMVPTPRGLEVLEAARCALEAMDRLFDVGDMFDPFTTQLQFKVGCPDYLSTVFLAGVAQEMRRCAPQAHFLVHPLGPGFNFEQALADGELDVVIGNWPEPPEQLHMGPLLEDEIVCLLSQQHPLAAGMTQEQYLAAPHVVPLHYSATHRGVIDKHLASLRLTRNARVVVPYFSMAPHMLPQTDLIFTISRHFAEHYAKILPLTVVSCPIHYPPMRFYQIWHGRLQHSQAQQWFRALLKSVAQRLVQRPA